MRFTLTIFEDGRALLTTPDELSPDDARRVMDVWENWKQTEQGVAIIHNCDVQHATSVEIELPV